MRHNGKSRSGAAAVEFAFVCPVLLMLIVGVVVGALGVFRFQEIAALAREASRFASVHGTAYGAATGNPVPDDLYIINNVIKKNAVGLDLTKLNCTINWPNGKDPYHTITNGSGQVVAIVNTVTVTIRYNWVPEAFFGGITMNTTSVAPMSF